MLSTLAYYIPKTRLKRTDVYFNGDRSEGRMGGKYPVSLGLHDEFGKEEFFTYELNHLVVDDESSYCLPFIDPGENWCVIYLCSILNHNNHKILKILNHYDL